MTPAQIDAFLNNRSERNKEAIEDALKKLDVSIVDSAAQIETRQDGSIVGPSRSLPQTKATLKEASTAFNEIYGGAIKLTTSFTDVDRVVQSLLGAPYSGVTKTTLTALIINDRNFHESLAGQTQNKLNAVLIDHVINGRQKSDLISSIHGILLGDDNIDGLGRPMSMHAGTIAQDGLMEYYSTAMSMSAKDAGVTDFLYYGSLIKDSRPWCVSHVGKTYTLGQIKTFDSQKWAGKKAGSTLINAGGYRCRHHFYPVVD